MSFDLHLAYFETDGIINIRPWAVKNPVKLNWRPFYGGYIIAHEMLLLKLSKDKEEQG